MRLLGIKLGMSKQKYRKGTHEERERKKKERKKDREQGNAFPSSLLWMCSALDHMVWFFPGGCHLVTQVVALGTCSVVLSYLHPPCTDNASAGLLCTHGTHHTSSWFAKSPGRPIFTRQQMSFQPGNKCFLLRHLQKFGGGAAGPQQGDKYSVHHTTIIWHSISV